MSDVRRKEILEGLRRRIAGGRTGPAPAALPFGVAAIDGRIPGGGLAAGALHEVICGTDVAHSAAAALFVAGISARLPGTVLWTFAHADLFAPGLAGAGLDPDRVIFVEARDNPTVLLVMEEGLRHGNLAAVVGELQGRLGLGPSRRLQLAAEASGVPAFVLRRRRQANQPGYEGEATAAQTRWRVTAQPSPPPLPHSPETPGLGRARWRLDLLRARGGPPCAFIVEACDAQGRLDLVAELAHGSVAPAFVGAAA